MSFLGFYKLSFAEDFIMMPEIILINYSSEKRWQNYCNTTSHWTWNWLFSIIRSRGEYNCNVCHICSQSPACCPAQEILCPGICTAICSIHCHYIIKDHINTFLQKAADSLVCQEEHSHLLQCLFNQNTSTAEQEQCHQGKHTT